MVKASGLHGLRVLIGAASLGAGTIAGAALPPVPVPAENPITEPKRVLGKALFFDEQLSTSNVVSCATCHVMSRAGSDPRTPQTLNPGADGILGTPDDVPGSPGIIRSSAENDFLRDAIYALRPQVTNRTANSPINAAYAPELFWDGRAKSRFTDPMTGAFVINAGGALESQAVGPVVNNIEMAHAEFEWPALVAKLQKVQPLALGTNRPADVTLALSDRPNYPELFRRAFGDPAITSARVAMAIATYQRTLISDQTPFDQFRAGNTAALTPNQVAGLNAYQGTGNCNACHSLANDMTTDHSFRNIGLRPPVEDLGRQLVTNDPLHRGQFKVPNLRNVGLKTRFMHNGQFTQLQQVIGFYAGARGRIAPNNVAPNGNNIDPQMLNIIIPPPGGPGPNVGQQIQDFIQNALTDPRVANQTFPFDRPTLFTERPADQIVLLGGGQSTPGDTIPVIIVQAPPLIGSDFRVGLDVPASLASAQATLAMSPNAPVNGRVIPTEIKGPKQITATTTGNNTTIHFTLSPTQFSNGQVMYIQWQIPAAAAPGGEARSNAAQIRFFCGSMGCPPRCPADINGSQATDIDDVFIFLNSWFRGSVTTDFDTNSAINIDDIFQFLNEWFVGC